MRIQSLEKGIITRIYLENFVTYNSVVVKPGRNLNLIIGPNGTGKSTIVCAIVLGLGGKTSIIGRARDIRDYVKAGCKEAKIEIELQNGQGGSIVVSRKFSTEGKSLWMLNGISKNIKEVQELISSFNIQIDNLCQFLPQDKVQDFSKMNAQQLLENTERSVGNPKLFEYHQELKEHRSHHKKFESDIVKTGKLLDSMNQRYNSLKVDVDIIHKRNSMKNKVTALKQKKAWLLYQQMQTQLQEMKRHKDVTAEEMKSTEIKLEPINAAISKMKSEINELEKSVNSHGSKTTSNTLLLTKIMKEILECERNIKEAEVRCTQKIEAEQNRDQLISHARQKKSKLDNDFAHMIKEIGSEETLMKEQKNAASAMERLQSVINKLMFDNTTCTMEESNCTQRIKAQEMELQSCNIEKARLELLKRRNIDAYQGACWLKENRDKFSGRVYEPMMLHINVKKVFYAKYFENIIPSRDLNAFVCENVNDMNLLMRYLRDEQKLRVNVVHSDPMKKVYMQPNIPIESIKGLGFQYYLASLIEAPPLIMQYLVSVYKLNNIPLGTNIVESNVDRIPQSFYLYFSENNRFGVNRSKYSAEKSVKISRVTGNNMLSIVLDRFKIQRIEEEIKTLQEKRAEIQNNAKKVNGELCEHNKQFENYRSNKSKYQHNIQQIQTLKSKINMISKEIENLQRERTTVEQIKMSCTNTIQEIIRRQLKLYTQYNSLLKERFKLVTTNEQVQLTLKIQKQSLLTKKDGCRELQEQFTAAQIKYKKICEEAQSLRCDTMKVYQEALQTTNGIGPDKKEFGSLQKTFNSLPPTIQDINKELSRVQARIFCMDSNLSGENILKEYDELEIEIQRLTEYIEEKSKELKTTESIIEKLREKWLPPLMELVELINKNFSMYFSEMKCAGEVTLDHGDNIMDFDQYGLKIRVKFRDSDELQVLTRDHQSGGERALTTAIYMISLQELSRVPFRCVDEINQGMDAINERRIFQLLVKMTGRPGSSQYFLLTPKLLPDLEYNQTVTVHCVFNGPFMINHTEFDVESYCKRVSRLARETQDD